jgi:hypothetical protein
MKYTKDSRAKTAKNAEASKSKKSPLKSGEIAVISIIRVTISFFILHLLIGRIPLVFKGNFY